MAVPADAAFAQRGGDLNPPPVTSSVEPKAEFQYVQDVRAAKRFSRAYKVFFASAALNTSFRNRNRRYLYHRDASQEGLASRMGRSLFCDDR